MSNPRRKEEEDPGTGGPTHREVVEEDLVGPGHPRRVPGDDRPRQGGVPPGEGRLLGPPEEGGQLLVQDGPEEAGPRPGNWGKSSRHH